MSGAALPPVLAVTAAGQARGAGRPRRRWPASRPGWVPRSCARPADRLRALLDQDGAAPNDAERARRRHLIVGRQGIDGTSEIRGLLDPEARATLDAVLAKWAAPGMGNPDDPSPCVDGTTRCTSQAGSICGLSRSATMTRSKPTAAPLDAGKPRPQTYLVSHGVGFDREVCIVSADDSQDVPGTLATQHNGLPPSPKR